MPVGGGIIFRGLFIVDGTEQQVDQRHAHARLPGRQVFFSDKFLKDGKLVGRPVVFNQIVLGVLDWRRVLKLGQPGIDAVVNDTLKPRNQFLLRGELFVCKVLLMIRQELPQRSSWRVGLFFGRGGRLRLALRGRLRDPQRFCDHLVSGSKVFLLGFLDLFVHVFDSCRDVFLFGFDPGHRRRLPLVTFDFFQIDSLDRKVMKNGAQVRMRLLPFNNRLRGVVDILE